MDKQHLLTFLQSQRILSISTVDDNNNPWIASVYFSINDKFEIFFISSPKSKHCEHLNLNHKVAFASAWFNSQDMSDRKGIQGTGECKQITNQKEIKDYLDNHYKFYPEWKESITVDKIINNKIESKPYVIKSEYIKFWNDELFEKDKTKEFKF